MKSTDPGNVPNQSFPKAFSAYPIFFNSIENSKLSRVFDHSHILVNANSN